MSEPVTRERPSVDLDDFERRMGTLRAEQHDDPLAELARLVGEQPDPYQDVFAQEAVKGGYDEHAYADHREPTFEQAPPVAPASRFAAIEAGLRGGFAPHAEGGSEHETHQQDYEPEAYAYQAAHQAQQPSRRPMYIMAATIAVGVLGIGAAFALKGHSTSPSDVKTIMAAAGPTKIQPPAEGSADPVKDPATGNQQVPTKLVSNSEEPVDVSQAVHDSAASGAGTDAASVPVPPTPGQSDGTQVASIGDFGVGMPEPKKVKVVSVRPDGTILSDDRSPAAPSTGAADISAVAPPAPAADDHPAPVAKASTPKVESAPKTVSRVVPTQAADAAPTDAPAKPARKAKPQKVASAESISANDGADAQPSKSKPTKLAMADPADTNAGDSAPKSAGGGSFAVQLAAPGSESEARSASSRLAKKFSSALGGRHLGFHKAQSNGKSVYRVRVGSLSKDEAVSLCEKLKSNGGSCFVAKN